MPILTTAIMNLLVVLVIGLVVGVVFSRQGRSRLGKQATVITGLGDATYALVGIAGSFIGFHVANILGLLPTPLMLYIGALIGAVLTVWMWKRR
jgi:uncharacterized membrane protein YeaQ/YmgE (transglycosylase-associated protein family)